MSIDPKKFFKENGNHFIETGVRPGQTLGFTVEQLYQNFEARFKAESKPKVPVIDNITETDNHFERWFDENEERLSIEAAETGADRELDFDFESFCEHKYSEFLKGAIT